MNDYTTGVCRYCGQLRNVFPAESCQEEANDRAAEQCNCPTADVAKRRRELARRRAKVMEEIKETAEAWCKELGQEEDGPMQALMAMAGEAIYDNVVDAATMSVDGIKITPKKDKNTVGSERAETLKRKASVG